MVHGVAPTMMMATPPTQGEVNAITNHITGYPTRNTVWHMTIIMGIARKLQDRAKNVITNQGKIEMLQEMILRLTARMIGPLVPLFVPTVKRRQGARTTSAVAVQDVKQGSRTMTPTTLQVVMRATVMEDGLPMVPTTTTTTTTTTTAMVQTAMATIMALPAMVPTKMAPTMKNLATMAATTMAIMQGTRMIAAKMMKKFMASSSSPCHTSKAPMIPKSTSLGQ
jgi:hypothetical protein